MPPMPDLGCCRLPVGLSTGATWPSFVGQLLSGRQAGPAPEELAREAARLGSSPEAAAAEQATEEAARLLEGGNQPRSTDAKGSLASLDVAQAAKQPSSALAAIE